MSTKKHFTLFSIIFFILSIFLNAQSTFNVSKPANGQEFYATNTDNTATIDCQARAVSSNSTYAVRIRAWVEGASILINPSETTGQQVSNYYGQVKLSPGVYTIRFLAEEKYVSWSGWQQIGYTESRTITIRPIPKYNITINPTDPDGGVYIIDGANYSSGTFQWAQNSNHNLVSPASFYSQILQKYYYFWKWNDGITSTSRSITVTGDANYSALYRGAPPSAPQNLHFTYSNPDHPSLGWDLNTESDISSYRIYRNYDNSSYWDIAEIVSHPTNTFIDYAISYTKPIWAKSVKYYVVAVDNTNLSSVPSDQIETTGIGDVLPAINIDDYTKTNTVAEDIYNFALFSNYPNPFNPETNISYSLPEKSFVTLKVYNILGSEIAELVNDFKEKGNYKVRFDGSKLSSGIYFYKLTAGNNNSIKKMLLIK